MYIAINYKNNVSKTNIRNLIFFVDEKYKLLGLKKYFTKAENNLIVDLLKSQNLSKKIISLDLSSKKKIFLISIEKNISSSKAENLGADAYNFLKDYKQKIFKLILMSFQQNLLIF